jgi:choice-of-anchor B domain-containing protein
MKQIYSLALLFLIALAPAFAQDAQSLNMTLFDHLNPVRTDSVGLSSALWGYVAPDGREYALVGTQIGTHIIDVTEKPIRQVGFIPGPRSSWREMKVYKNYAYIVTEARDYGHGLQIVDLSHLPASVELVRTDSVIFASAHTIFINGHYMYAMGTNVEAGANQGVIIFDLEPDPLHPQRVGMVGPYYYHDAWERNDTMVCAAIHGEGCDLYDVRDRSNPKPLASITYPYSGTHNCEITSDGGYVVTTDEVNFTAKTLKVWDIHDLPNITKVAEYTPSPNDIVHNVHIRGRYAVVAWYTAGVRIIDMIDPTHPREVAYYDTFQGNSGGYDGVWESYLFPSHKVIAGDRQNGLFVLEFNMATAGSVSGVVRNATTGDPLPGAIVRVPETGQTVVADAVGHYYVGGADGAKITLATHEFGYGATNDTLTLTGDQQRDIRLAPLELLTATLRVQDQRGNPVTEFAYAIEPYLHSTTASGATATLLLPRDSSFTLTVGKWGYGMTRMPAAVTANNQEIVVTLKREYVDDATLNLGWSFQAADDDATSGRWTRLVPYIAFPGADWIYPNAEPPGGPDGYVFQTGTPPHDAAPQTGDVIGGHTSLVSPPMDLRGYGSPRIDFDLWFVQYRVDASRDTMLVQLSSDDGASWHTAYAETEGRSGWKHHSIEVGAYVALSDHMRVRLVASNRQPTALFFAAMDNFNVNDNGSPAAAPVASPELREMLTLAVRPNPMQAGGSVAVVARQAFGAMTIELYNSAGSRVALLHEGALPAGEWSFPVDANLPSGSYRVRAVDGSGRSWSAAMVVVK